MKVCAVGRGAASLTQSRGVRRETPGSSTYLRAKAGGDKSMSEKRESLEGVYDAVPQDPRDMVKATLPESPISSGGTAHSPLPRLGRGAITSVPFEFRGTY